MDQFRMTRLSELTYNQTVDLWKRGFEGYMVDIAMPMNQLIGRFGLEGLSPELSVVAWDGNEPIGFIMNGIRTIKGKRVAWNGGTGVIVDYRRRGVGKQLMEASLAVYRENNVDLATLEAISTNLKAIPLYEKMGYQVVGRVGFLRRQGTYSPDGFEAPATFHYHIHNGIARDVDELSFYNTRAPWQSQWHNARDAESLMVRNHDDEAVGYAVFKRVYDADGVLKAIVLYQCEVAPNHPETSGILRKMLEQVYGSAEIECQRSTTNVDLNNEQLITILKAAGFSGNVEQVYMERPMLEQ